MNIHPMDDKTGFEATDDEMGLIPSWHTPGPWHTVNPREEAAAAGVENDSGWISICSEGGLIGSMYMLGEEQNLINAHLVAAAPDLYAAIKNSDDAHWTTAMRAAMAKAEGR